MSLFDTIASRVTAGLSNSLPSVSAIDTSTLGTLASGIGKSAIGTSIAGNLIGKYAPKGLQGTLTRALRGDVAGALTDGVLGFLKGKAAHALGKNPLLGGITLEEAARLATEVNSTNFARKNLFYLELGDWKPIDGFEDISHVFNLFATNISYTPHAISSEGKSIGMGVMDTVTGAERVDLKITTYDDAKGTIKQWFNGKCRQVAHADGTLGLPIEYLVTIKIIQSATDEIGAALFGGHKSSFIMRPASIEIDLSRSDKELQTLSLSFVEFDTFMYK